jgi:hypothetical protein
MHRDEVHPAMGGCVRRGDARPRPSGVDTTRSREVPATIASNPYPVTTVSNQQRNSCDPGYVRG